MTNDPSLAASRAAIGGAGLWSAVDIVGRQVVTLITTMFLARLLTPADFGAVAISAFFATIVIAVVQDSLSIAVVQRHTATHEEISSIFWWNVIVSLAIALVLIAARHPIARYFQLPELAPLLTAAAAQLFLASFGTVPAALLSRRLRLNAIAKTAIPAAIVSGMIGIALAYWGAGVWALAAQLVSSAALCSFGYWVLSGWRPAAVLRATGLSEAIGFARWIGLSAGLDVLYAQGFALVLGKLYGPRDLGLYGRAASTQQAPASAVTAIISRVALPLLSQRHKDPGALRRGLLMANGMAMVIMMPAMVGLTLTAGLTIRVLFGPQWDKTAPILAILTWTGLLFPLSWNNLQLLLASGRPEMFFRLEVVKKVVGVLSIIVGSFFGMVGLAWSQLVFATVSLLIDIWPSHRYFGCGLLAQFSALAGTAIATTIMGAGVVAFRATVHLPPLAELAGAIAVGFTIYVLASLVLRVRAFTEAVTVISGYLRQEEPASTLRSLSSELPG